MARRARPIGPKYLSSKQVTHLDSQFGLGYWSRIWRFEDEFGRPLSSLWKVTRSISPEICSVEGLRSGVAAFMDGLQFAITGVLGRQARTRLAAHPRNAAINAINGKITPAAPRGDYRRGDPR